MGEVFLCLGRYEFVAACGYRARFVGGKRSDITPYASAGHYIVGNDPCVVPYRGMLLTDLFLCERRLIPLISRLRRQTACSFLPPEGKPSLRCANRANIILCCGLLLRSALIRRLRQQTARSFLLPLKGEGFGARLSHPVLLFKEYFLMDESLKHSLYSLQNQRKASPRGEAGAVGD